MVSAKMAILGLLKIKVFWSKGYDIIISLCNVINKSLPRDSNFILDVVLKFYPSLEKVLKDRNFLGLILKFVESTEEKLVGKGDLFATSSWIGLKINTFSAKGVILSFACELWIAYFLKPNFYGQFPGFAYNILISMMKDVCSSYS